MNPARKTAIIVGVLFITATVAFISGYYGLLGNTELIEEWRIEYNQDHSILRDIKLWSLRFYNHCICR